SGPEWCAGLAASSCVSAAGGVGVFAESPHARKKAGAPRMHVVRRRWRHALRAPALGMPERSSKVRSTRVARAKRDARAPAPGKGAARYAALFALTAARARRARRTR